MPLALGEALLTPSLPPGFPCDVLSPRASFFPLCYKPPLFLNST